MSLCSGHTYVGSKDCFLRVHCAASIMGESGTFGGDRDWATFVLGSGEKMAAQSSN